MSSSSTSLQWKHDVFVSFDPDDRMKDFIKGLFDWLNQVGISYFTDDKREGVRSENNTTRPEAISSQSFAIALVVFSKKYLNSKTCQRELTKILDSKRRHGLVVIPIFYMDRDEASKWARDNKHVGDAQNISSYVSRHLSAPCALAQDESKVIDIIVERLVKEIHSLYPSKAFGPFGGKGAKTQEWKSNEINGITVCYSNFIKSIDFRVGDGTRLTPKTSYGGNGKENTFQVKLNTGEYISSLAGYFENAEVKKIKSLTLRTNKRTLGPIGVEKERDEDKYFSVPSKAGKVIEIFCRTKNSFLEFIGARVELHSREFDPVKYEKLFQEKISFWDDGNQCDNVRKIIVELELNKEPLIRSIEFQCKEKDRESEENGSNTVQHVKSYTIKADGPDRYLTSISKSIGTFGGENAWDDGKFDGVKEIYLQHDIRYIRFVYDNGNEKVKVTHPQGIPRDDKEKEIILDYPREYLTSISGYKKGDGSISWLIFYSNKTKYESGKEKNGQYFCIPATGSRIIGFYGTCKETLKSIGVHVEPIPYMRPFEIVRPPLEGSGGTPWDDGVHSDVTGFHVSIDGNKIKSITFEYDDRGSKFRGDRHGGGKGNPAEFKKLKFPEERLLQIKGYMRSESGQTIIHNLEICTTHMKMPVDVYAERKYCGSGSKPFEIPIEANKGRRIVGFWGMAGSHLNSIGGRLEPY